MAKTVFLVVALIVLTNNLANGLECYHCLGQTGIESIPDVLPAPWNPISQCKAGTGIPDIHVLKCEGTTSTLDFIQAIIFTIEPSLSANKNLTTLFKDLKAKSTVKPLANPVCGKVEISVKVQNVEVSGVARSCADGDFVPVNTCETETVLQLLEEADKLDPTLQIPDIIEAIKQAGLGDLLSTKLSACSCDTDKCLANFGGGGGGGGATTSGAVFSFVATLLAFAYAV